MSPLSHDEMKQLLKRLDELCREAEELQLRIRTAMVARARGDLPNRRGQPGRRSTPRQRS